MDNESFNIRVPKRWARIAMIVGATALIVAPLTAVATHSFNDVPNSHTFHGNIEWLKASGVTKGCNPPANTLFCPDDNVTRGQMAAFMERFAEYLDAEDGTPAQADNADRVDGAHAADLRTTLDGLLSFGGQGGVPDIPLPAGTSVVVLENALSGSDGDFALVSYGFTGWDESASTNRLVAWLQVNNSTCDPNETEEGTQVFDSPPVGELSSLAGSAVIPISGNTTITLCGLAVNGNATVLNAHLNSIQTDTGEVLVTAANTSQAGPAAAEGEQD